MLAQGAAIYHGRGIFWKRAPGELYSPSSRIGSSDQGFGKLIYVAAFTGESLVTDISVL